MLESHYQLQCEHWESELKRYGYEGDLTNDQVKALHISLSTHLISESMEVLECSDWKLHKVANDHVAEKRVIAEECVDVYKFLLNMLLLHDITPAEFNQAFLEKSAVVKARVLYEQVKANPKMPYFFCDLDGVLCDRDAASEKMFGAPFSHTRRVLLTKHYEAAKDTFYREGGFLTAPAMYENCEILSYWEVAPIIITSRDVKRYPYLYYQTLSWLEQHGIPYTALVFAAEKEREICWTSGSSVAIDDEPEHYEKLHRVCNAHLYDGPKSLANACQIFDRIRTAYNASQLQRKNS